MARQRSPVRVVHRDGSALVTDTIARRGKISSTHAVMLICHSPFTICHMPSCSVFRRSERSTITIDAASAVDAIIVPTVRAADQLRPAADLAAQLGCPLIAIYSQRSADELSSIQREFELGNVIVVGLPRIFRRIYKTCSLSRPTHAMKARLILRPGHQQEAEPRPGCWHRCADGHAFSSWTTTSGILAAAKVTSGRELAERVSSRRLPGKKLSGQFCCRSRQAPRRLAGKMSSSPAARC